MVKSELLILNSVFSIFLKLIQEEKIPRSRILVVQRQSFCLIALRLLQNQKSLLRWRNILVHVQLILLLRFKEKIKVNIKRQKVGLLLNNLLVIYSIQRNPLMVIIRVEDKLLVEIFIKNTERKYAGVVVIAVVFDILCDKNVTSINKIYEQNRILIV